MANRYTDDEGLFQGGKYGRRFGRFRDWWEENTADPLGNRDRRQREQFADRMGYEGDIPTTGQYTQSEEYYTPQQQYYQGIFGDDFETDPYQRNVQKSFDVDKDFMMARDYALDFDVNDPDQVRILQKRLNLVDDLGIEPLEEDGVMGPKTQAALEKIQSMAQRNPGKQFGFENTPELPAQYSSEEMSQRLDADRGSLLNRVTPEMYDEMDARQRQKLDDMGYSSWRNIFGMDQRPVSRKAENLEQFYRQDDAIRNNMDYGRHANGQPITRGYYEAPWYKKAADWALGGLYDL